MKRNKQDILAQIISLALGMSITAMLLILIYLITL
jgi:hypothetical protein